MLGVVRIVSKADLLSLLPHTATYRRCDRCGETLPLSEFSWLKAYKGTPAMQAVWCKVCVQKTAQALRREVAPRAVDPLPRFPPAFLYRQRLRKYNLSEDQYVALLAAQDGHCALCPTVPSATALCIDHDHACCPGSGSCGKCVRGLLCGPCNRMLGLAFDSPAVLRAGAEYLERAIQPTPKGDAH